MRHLARSSIVPLLLWGIWAMGQTLAGPDLKPTGRGQGEPAGAAAPGKPSGNNGIYYHGGPLILGTVNIHYIWYGNWSGNSAVAILDDFATDLGGSPYFNINTTYYNASGTSASNSAILQPDEFDNYSRGTQLSDADIQAIVAARYPTDQNGVYIVLTSSDVGETSGFCTQYCGWHQHATLNGLDIKFAFVGSPDRCPSACEAQSTGPNDNAGADAMASVIAHELEESITDPEFNAWYDHRGLESADKCDWTFGATYSAANGSLANMRLGSRDYLIQENWVNAGGGYCGVGYDGGAASPGGASKSHRPGADGTNPWSLGGQGPAPKGDDGTNPWPLPPPKK